jgi:hypothetical protein
MKIFFNLLKKKIIIFTVIFSFISPLNASITDDLLKLSKMYNEGLLSKQEFEKAKSILLEIETIQTSESKKDDKKNIPKISKKTKKKSDVSSLIKIERIYVTENSKFTNKSFEKMKLTVGDFMIYTHRPGAIKIKKISDNKQYAVIGDNLRVKYYNNGSDFFDINVDKKNKELILKINDSTVLIWKGQYIQKAEATFYQMLAMGRLPFHFYVKLDTADNAFALNMEKFNRQIELAVIEVKEDLAEEFNLSISQIDQIIDQNDMLAAYGEKIPTNNQFSKTEQKEYELYNDLKKSIGDDNFKMLTSSTNDALQSEIKKTVSDEVQVIIDETIRDAINSGIETAALQAGINALLDALMSGASWADALTAGQNACGCE